MYGDNQDGGEEFDMRFAYLSSAELVEKPFFGLGYYSFIIDCYQNVISSNFWILCQIQPQFIP